MCTSQRPDRQTVKVSAAFAFKLASLQVASREWRYALKSNNWLAARAAATLELLAAGPLLMFVFGSSSLLLLLLFQLSSKLNQADWPETSKLDLTRLGFATILSNPIRI